MKKDIKDYLKKNVAILCKTDKEAKEINNLIAKNGGRSLYHHWINRFSDSKQYHNGLEFGLDTPHNSYCYEGYYAKNGYTVYPASDFLESATPIFKFNIGQEVKMKEGGYYFSNPEEENDDYMPFTTFHRDSRDLGLITNRAYYSGRNWYAFKKYGNWITEEGLELVKEAIPEYVQLCGAGWAVKEQFDSLVGEIFELSTLDNLSKVRAAPSKQSFRDNIVAWVKSGYFKPSTKEAFEAQNSVKSPVKLEKGKYYTSVTVHGDHYYWRFEKLEGKKLHVSGYRLRSGWIDTNIPHWNLSDNLNICEIDEYTAKGIEKPKEENLVGRYLKVLPNFGNTTHQFLKIKSQDSSSKNVLTVEFPQDWYNLPYRKDSNELELMPVGFSPKEETSFKVGDSLYCHTDLVMSSGKEIEATKGKTYKITEVLSSQFKIENNSGRPHHFNFKDYTRWFSRDAPVENKKETLLETAKRLYPVGTKYIDAGKTKECEVKGELRESYATYGTMITDGYGGAVHYNGIWANRVEESPKEVKTECVIYKGKDLWGKQELETPIVFKGLYAQMKEGDWKKSSSKPTLIPIKVRRNKEEAVEVKLPRTRIKIVKPKLLTI